MEQSEKDIVQNSEHSKNEKKKWFIILLLFLVICISIGYASLTSNLDINGSSKIKGQTWDVHFEQISNITKVGDASDNGTGESPAVIRELSTTPSDMKDDQNIDFSISLKKPGDSYSFKAKVVNNGTLNANVKLSLTNLVAPASNYLTWTVDGISTSGTLVSSGGEKQFTVTVQYKDSVTTLPSSDVNCSLSAQLTATQA